MNAQKILIVEDERSLLDTIALRLRREGYTVFTAETAESALNILRREKPNLVILDVMLPGKSGFDFAQIARTESNVPILFLSARVAPEDRLKGFAVGGDDYLTKPFNLSELSARVRAILRRYIPDESPIITIGDLEVDGLARIARKNGQPLPLRPRVFDLLYFLASHPNIVFSRQELLQRVWGPRAHVTSRTVDVHILWLRQHVEEDPKNPKLIQTVRGQGYRLTTQDEHPTPQQPKPL
jgi:DNA-binding response OmpR family regulator